MTEPDFIVRWEPRRRAFTASVKVVLSRVPSHPLTSQVRTGIQLRVPASSLLLHGVLLYVWISLVPARGLMLPYKQPIPSDHHAYSGSITYFVRHDLPNVSGLDGAQEGRTGESGGKHLSYSGQTIRVVRGSTAVSAIADAPRLRLPVTNAPVANLLVITVPPTAPSVQLVQPLEHAESVQIPPVAPLPPHELRSALPNVRPNVAPPPHEPAPRAEGKDHLPEATHLDQQTASAEIVITRSPDSTPGISSQASNTGVVVLSSFGGNSPGYGGKGEGNGTASGKGQGSGKTGGGPGSGRVGNGLGSDPRAHGGIATGSGPGGAGGGATKNTIPGVSISGGVITLPSFGASASGDQHRDSQKHSRPPALVVVGTARSGGAMRLEGLLRGSRVYTIYLDIPNASVVLQYSDPVSNIADPELSPPEPIDTVLQFPTDHMRTIVSGILDRNGILKRLRIVQSSHPDVASRILSALSNWRFRPALRSGKAVDVEAVLGFSIDTK